MMTGYIAANCEQVGLPFSSLMQTIEENLEMISESARTSSSFTEASSLEGPVIFLCPLFFMTFENLMTCDNHNKHCLLGLGLSYCLLHTSIE